MLYMRKRESNFKVIFQYAKVIFREDIKYCAYKELIESISHIALEIKKSSRTSSSSQTWLIATYRRSRLWKGEKWRW